MTLMAWSPPFETGLALVDAQHHALVDMVNLAAPHLALNDEVAKRAVVPLLNNLTHYAVVHFRDEELLMAQSQLAPEYQVHHQQTHQAFVDEVKQMRRQYEQDGSLSGTDLLRFLGSWLSFHILVEDQRMAVQIREVAAGQSAQVAFEHVSQPQDGAHAVYNSSLLDLFTLLTERNRKLSLVNEEVQRVKAALERANLSLEARVQQRTQDLAATVARLEQTQARLLQSEKMAAVGQLAAGVAHEINNPVGFVNSNLGALANYTQQLFELLASYEKAAAGLSAQSQSELAVLRQKIDVDYLREDIPGLLAESKGGLARVTRIVADLRDFTRADEGQSAPADLNQALERALNIVGNAVSHKASIVRQLEPLPLVVCNLAQITQVLVNLLLNAAQAIAKQGTITLRSGVQPPGKVWLEISDTGCGMSDEVQKRIFEPFFTTQPVGSGTGLGLSVGWEIVTHHHGQLDVQSVPGQGSTFRVTLPEHPASP
jgi:hemerythrin-like metal-binding protein